MSDPLVIAIIRTQLQTLDVPYVETMNVRPDRLPDEFTSIERDYSVVERITIGEPDTQFREIGTITAVVNVRAGTGTERAEVVCELVRNLFHNFAQGFFRIEQVSAGAVFDPDDGSFFQMKIPVAYQFDFFK